MLGGIIRGAALGLGSVVALAGCEIGTGVLDPREGLSSGYYRYEAWSDVGGRDPAWWGYLDLEVDYDGTIYGTYRLPNQCEDYRYLVDCRGRVSGRVYRDGTIRFGFDEGWIANHGRVLRGDEAVGEWDTRLLGYRDRGDFELYPY